ncbi:MAG: hypothetical protein LBK58_08780 [Prevotellaceae bacterium]|nr:hypothetical protein [Prevotellaceae bacterium]
MEEIRVEKEIEKRAFQVGWAAVPQGVSATVRARIIFALGVSTNQAFRDHLNGYVYHSVVDVENIEAIFNEYGITDIWGKVESPKAAEKAKLQLLNTKLRDQGLSNRTMNCMKYEGIETLGDLVKRERVDLQKARNLGEKTLEELDGLLKKHHLYYGMEI